MSGPPYYLTCDACGRTFEDSGPITWRTKWQDDDKWAFVPICPACKAKEERK